MQVGFVGLGRMGGRMVERVRRHSAHEVVGYDVDPGAAGRGEAAGATIAGSLEELVDRLRAPRVIWLMLPPGRPTHDAVDELVRLVGRGDVVVDGGNSQWTDGARHGSALGARGASFVDVGTSGGVWGAEAGYCLMVGGAGAAVGRIGPILDALAPPAGAAHGPGWAHVGPSGAGHFVKMVHNAIEYGLMQAYAEGFDLIASSGLELDSAQIAHLWMGGAVVRSWLCELAARSFDAHGNELAGLDGHTEDSGQGRWALAAATELAVPMPVLAASLHARFYSRGGGRLAHRLLASLRGQFGGHAVRPAATGAPRS